MWQFPNITVEPGSRPKIFLVERLCDLIKRCCVILCMERLHDFCMWRGCVILLTHSLTQVAGFFSSSGGCVIFFCREVLWFFCWKIAWFFVWRCCLIFFVKRLHDFCVKRCFFSKKKNWWNKIAKNLFWGIFFWWNTYFVKKWFLGYYCHYRHYCHYCHYCNYCNYCHIGK